MDGPNPPSILGERLDMPGNATLSSTPKQRFHCPLPNTTVFCEVLIRTQDALLVASLLLLHEVQKYDLEATRHSTYQPCIDFFFCGSIPLHSYLWP